MENKITYEIIKKANETINTTDIKGKEYAEVNQRVKAFRMVYPTGFILTRMVSDENGVCVFDASVGYYDENGDAVTISRGTAYEKENSTFINKTSYIENCETSAVGRALGFAGFGIDTSIASAEEVANAIENQNKKIEKKQITQIKKLIPEENFDAMLNYYKIEKIEDMSFEDAKALIERKTKKVEANVNREDS